MDRKYTLFSAILIINFLLQPGCKKEEFSWGQNIGDITYSGNVVFLGRTELAELKEVTSGRLVFAEKTGNLSDITETSILLGGVSDKTPYGFLRAVSTISSDGGDMIITTTDATLPEAVKEGTIKFSARLLEKDFTLRSKVDGVLVTGKAKSWDGLAITLDDLEIMRNGINSARLDGAIGVSPEVNITIILKFNQITRINVSTTFNKIEEVSVISNSSFNGLNEITAAEFIHSPVVIDSMVFVPEVIIKTGYDGSISSSVTTGVRQDRTIYSELKYEDYEWSESPMDQSVSYDFLTPSLSDNSDLKIFSEPELIIYLFGVPLQNITAAGYYSLHAQKNGSPFWRLSIGNDGQNIINSAILGSVSDYTSSLVIESSEIGNSNSK